MSIFYFDSLRFPWLGANPEEGKLVWHWFILHVRCVEMCEGENSLCKRVVAEVDYRYTEV